MTRFAKWICGFLLAAGLASAADGLLVVAHGAREGGWNERVLRLVEKIDWPGPKGAAFLMAGPPEQSLPAVAARLEQEGVQRIVVVPLLVSSFSEHYEEIRYYTGEREDAPHHAHNPPLKTAARLILAGGMDGHPLVSRILLDQVRAISREPDRESLVLVAHGPNEDRDNERWVACLQSHAAWLQKELSFRRADVATLRDDAPKPVRNAATQALRSKVASAGADTRVLVVPVLISVGRIQAEIRERLQGLDYEMSQGGLSDHPLAAEWIRQQALQPADVNWEHAR